jgi:hypothetical protein
LISEEVIVSHCTLCQLNLLRKVCYSGHKKRKNGKNDLFSLMCHGVPLFGKTKSRVTFICAVPYVVSRILSPNEDEKKLDRMLSYSIPEEISFFIIVFSGTSEHNNKKS